MKNDDNQKINTTCISSDLSNDNKRSNSDNPDGKYVSWILATIIGSIASAIVACSFTIFSAINEVLTKQKDVDSAQQRQLDSLEERSISRDDRVDFEVRLQGAEKDISYLKGKH